MTTWTMFYDLYSRTSARVSLRTRVLYRACLKAWRNRVARCLLLLPLSSIVFVSVFSGNGFSFRRICIHDFFSISQRFHDNRDDTVSLHLFASILLDKAMVQLAHTLTPSAISGVPDQTEESVLATGAHENA